MPQKITIIYAEDKENVRTMISSLLERHNIFTIATAGNGKELIEKIYLAPNVVLLDLEMPVMDGNAALDYILQRNPSTKVIVVSYYYEELLGNDYIKRGAKGYISKDALAGDINLLVEGIKKVNKGGVFVHYLPRERKKLSTRQEQIVPMIVEGFTNKEIAEEIGVQERAVEKQRQKIYTKVGGRRAVDFYRYVFSKGLQFLGKFRRS